MTMKLFHCASVALLIVLSSRSGRAQSTLFTEDFESGLSGWVVIHPPACGAGVSCSGGVTWAAANDSTDCAQWAVPFPSGSKCARFGHVQNCNYAGDNNAIPTAELRSVASIALPTGAVALTLRFFTKSDAEANDLRTVEIDPGFGAPIVLDTVSSSDWHEETIDLAAYAGNSVQIVFRFVCSDATMNDGNGWFVDDVRVESASNIAFCSGDGSATTCPCGNAGAAGHGCASSFDPTGAQLVGSGTPSVGADTMTLSAAGLSSSSVLFFQGTQPQAGGQGVVFGDGLRCAGGAVVRLATLPTAGGTAQFPGLTSPMLHVAGVVPPGGGMRTYQVWYRNAAPFCTSSTFNLSNGLLVNWVP